MIAGIEHTRHGAGPRYTVTSLPGEPQALYEQPCCARGDIGNRTRQNRPDLLVDRTSCRQWWAHPLRLLLASLAYASVETIRRVGLKHMHRSVGTAGDPGAAFPLNKPSGSTAAAIICGSTQRFRLALADCEACPAH